MSYWRWIGQCKPGCKELGHCEVWQSALDARFRIVPLPGAFALRVAGRTVATRGEFDVMARAAEDAFALVASLSADQSGVPTSLTADEQTLVRLAVCLPPPPFAAGTRS